MARCAARKAYPLPGMPWQRPMPFFSSPRCHTTLRLLDNALNMYEQSTDASRSWNMRLEGVTPLHELVKVVRVCRTKHGAHHRQHHGHAWRPVAPMHQPAQPWSVQSSSCCTGERMILTSKQCHGGRHRHGTAFTSRPGSQHEGDRTSHGQAKRKGRTRRVNYRTRMVGCQSRGRAEWRHFQHWLGSTSLCRCRWASSVHDASTSLAPTHPLWLAGLQ